MASHATTLDSYDTRKRNNVFESNSNENPNNPNQSEDEGHNGKWPPLGYETVSSEPKSSVQLPKPQINMPISNDTNFKVERKPLSNSTSTNVGADVNTLHHILPKNQLRSSGPMTDTSGDGSISSDVNVPVCKNCLTSTTPLWRRDEHGAVLCNACGLFLKLHGKPRPISLKTDVIKSRNRKSNTNHAHNLDNFRNQTLVAELKSEGSVESSNRKVSKLPADDKKKKISHISVGLASAGKISKISKMDQKDKSDSHISATKLEVLMSADSSRPKLKPKLLKQEAPVQQERLLTFPSYTDIKEHSDPLLQSTATKERPQFGTGSLTSNATHSVASKTGADSPQLPHLSMLLGSLNSGSVSNNISETVSSCNNGIVSTAATLAPTSSRTTDSNPSDIPNQIRSTMSSPDIVSAKRNDPTPLSFHMASINDMLETKDGSAKTDATVSHFKPLIQSSKAPYLPTANSSATFNSVLSLDVASERKRGGHPTESLTGDYPLSAKLHKEEEIIRLKTRINELELVTDLYRRHINELDGKCKALEERLENAEPQNGYKSR
ncbi:Gzf3p [Saccharomyces eubayanus]|uniref:Gzf3p n=1 Tax=Saccharomyces eubayanus TaxID=1080349 RepID=UPI0006C0E11C|nr:GZF3-like protein [Saccharomyces eubayanus]KOG98501.1 GZF3-like protein [Saccharomyces eubayanus]